jgi:mitogen-activated protein kinase kinase kinase
MTPGMGPPTYNPKIHSITNGTLVLPPPPPPVGDGMSATYIPGADTYGEGVGIPGLGIPVDEMTLSTPIDELVGRDRLYPNVQTNRGASTASNSPSVSGVPPEMANQWPMEKVVQWLQAHQFSKNWQETFKALNLPGATFLELGSWHGGRGNFGMMHQQVYPRLAQECITSGTGWDQPKEREEGRRMRRLIRGIVTGRPVDPSRSSSGHGRNNSVAQSMPTSAGPDSADSPNVSDCSWCAIRHLLISPFRRPSKHRGLDLAHPGQLRCP